MKSNRSNRSSRALLAAILVLASASQVGCGQKAEGDEAPKGPVGIPVEVATAVTDTITASYQGTAALEAERQAQVVAKVSGVLLSLKTEEGQRVREGQVLAQLDAERSRLEVRRSAATLTRLQNNFQRAEELYGKKLISTDNIDQVRAELDSHRAAHALAQLELEYTTITAPIDGVISKRLVKEGNLIQLNQTLFQIDDFDPLQAVLNVPERELSIMRAGLAVSMTVDALPGEVFTGEVARVSPTIEAGTGTFRVTTEFRDPSNRLTSGMFGRLSIVYDTRTEALVIPREALIEEDGEAYVFAIGLGVPVDVAAAKKDDGQGGFSFRMGGNDEAEAEAAAPAPTTIAERRVVAVGFSEGDRIEIRDGLAAGDRVVTIGRAAIRDGVAVNVLEPAK